MRGRRRRDGGRRIDADDIGAKPRPRYISIVDVIARIVIT